MRKAVFLNFPTHGCINPLLSTVSELVRRGERIIYYCTDEFKAKIEQTGAEFRSYKGLVNKFEYSKNDDLVEALKLTVEMTVDKIDYNLESIRKENPDYIIHDSLCTWGKHIASILNIPAVNLMHSYPITKSSIKINTKTILFFIKVAIYKFNNSLSKRLKKKYGISVSFGDILINKEDINIVYTSKQMDLSVYQSEKTYCFVGPSLFFKNEQNNFPFDDLKNKKVIYVSLGTLHNRNIRFYQTCIKTLTNSEFYVVISIGFDLDLNEFVTVSNNFLIRQSVPQQKLLEYVDIFISHAGMNSVNEAICNGVPMLLLPHQFEQEMIANKVEEMGIGIKMNIKKITAKKLHRIVYKLYSDLAYKKQALKFKNEFKEEEKISHIKAADEILTYIKNIPKN